MARINLISFFKFYEIKVQFRCNDVAKRYNFLKHTTCITKDIDKYSAKHLKKFRNYESTTNHFDRFAPHLIPVLQLLPIAQI